MSTAAEASGEVTLHVNQPDHEVIDFTEWSSIPSRKLRNLLQLAACNFLNYKRTDKILLTKSRNFPHHLRNFPHHLRNFPFKYLRENSRRSA